MMLKRARSKKVRWLWQVVAAVCIAVAACMQFTNTSLDTWTKVKPDPDDQPHPLAILLMPKPLSGHEAFKSRGLEIFPEGVVARLNLGKRKGVSSSLSISSVKLQVKEFTENPHIEDESLFDHQKAPGLGTAPVECWNAVLDGNHKIKLFWVTAPGGAQEIKTPNLLESEPPVTFQVSGTHQDSSDLEINIGTVKSGLYQVNFQVEYAFQGKQIIDQSTTICIYKR